MSNRTVSGVLRRLSRRRRPDDRLAAAVADYTAGRRRPTEAEAVLLVERHLGDPDRLAALLGRPPIVATGRRLAAAVVATCAAVAVMRVGYAGWLWRTRAADYVSLYTVQDGDVAWWLADAVVPLVLAGLLLRWRRAERAGRRP